VVDRTQQDLVSSAFHFQGVARLKMRLFPQQGFQRLSFVPPDVGDCAAHADGHL
jgi:hypothetical protein